MIAGAQMSVRALRAFLALLALSGWVPAFAQEQGDPLAEAAGDEVRELQDEMRADPEIMDAIDDLRSDPEVKAILDDPSVAAALRSGDLGALLANPKIGKLIDHPAVKEINEELED